jgi:hypothetical protein
MHFKFTCGAIRPISQKKGDEHSVSRVVPRQPHRREPPWHLPLGSHQVRIPCLGVHLLFGRQLCLQLGLVRRVRRVHPLTIPEIDLIVKTVHDKEPSNLDVIAESSPKKGAVHSSSKLGDSPPTITRKKSIVSLRGKTSIDTLPAATAPPRRDVSASTHPPIRELKTRPRPISVSGIPSPSPTRANSEHVRRDKYGSLIGNSHRRTGSVRSVSTNIENKLSPESKLQVSSSRLTVPPREASKVGTQNQPRTAKAVQPPPPVSRDSSRPPTSNPHRRQLSKDLNPPSRSQLHPKPSQKTLRPQPSKDLSSPTSSRQNTIKSAALRKQPSKDLSPTPSIQSSPNPKSKSTYSFITDSPPEQVRLLQLLHLIPLSQSNVALYESSAHQTLSTRYNALQTRFQKIQKHDHAQYLADTLVILKSWSDAHIRTLSTLLVDWESLSADFRAFCKRLHSTLKPINKSVIEEKGKTCLGSW